MKHRKRLLISIFCLMGLIQNSVTWATPKQSLESISQAVEQYLQNNYHASGDFEYQMSTLDQRLKLPLCNNPLEIFTPYSALKTGRNSLGIRCSGKKKWTIYTSVLIKTYRDVLVLAQPIQRGEILTSNHLRTINRELSQLRSGYIENPQQIINKQANRNLSTGTVINLRHFSVPKLIKKGDRVKITHSSPYFQISMNGIAMKDGKKGENITVKNINSQRIVQATVIKPGQVTVF